MWYLHDALVSYLCNHLSRTPKINHYKRSTPPISVPLNKLFSNTFPLSIHESIQDYKVKDDLFSFQHNLLSTLPFYPNPDKDGRSSEVIQVPIDENNNYINEYVIYPNHKTKKAYASANHLVMVHGYGSGLGLFLKNFGAVTMDNWVVHAIDLFGYGCSSRPPFTPTSFEQVEAWFHDSFATWMRRRQIPRQNALVMAHSMGAYLMASYGINVDPDFCRRLVMVSPGGIIDHKKPIVIPAYFERLWERNISPFSLVRKASFYGSKLVSGWSYRRFSELPDSERVSLHKYVYGIFQARGSGEYMLNYLLKPGANPRHPMVDRKIERCNCQFDWWYGQDDWMNVHGGEVCSERLRRSGKSSTVVEIADAGHHVYLDNATEFNRMLVEKMRDW
ncbi:alpha/beta-hydrolase [Yamadazyma tenuis ATCC 10573]|uniref:Alpha/beta-hydrolase n=1 Tax=Candida tenuis (strain ATCC 10573 / BCRC 21748 / CBS 615 / JCM 9827 / NBRC 10315 / NRRL Y-1498 / VKM Y-70) TaxID=590646 RepID=G3B6S6_CANTC|nr:alpha/beta-hydrolase [Yamadazyma tenuis ATCC 10573]EGV63008.1 alpha/beta-hydrolase [Yamadazyma tenuis ATCC 10573]